MIFIHGGNINPVNFHILNTGVSFKARLGCNRVKNGGIRHIANTPSLTFFWV